MSDNMFSNITLIIILVNIFLIDYQNDKQIQTIKQEITECKATKKENLE